MFSIKSKTTNCPTCYQETTNKPLCKKCIDELHELVLWDLKTRSKNPLLNELAKQIIAKQNSHLF